jgi:hypothetical protein
VVPGASCAADLHPGDADRLQFARTFDAAEVDRGGPAEVGQQVADDALASSSSPAISIVGSPSAKLGSTKYALPIVLNAFTTFASGSAR